MLAQNGAAVKAQPPPPSQHTLIHDALGDKGYPLYRFARAIHIRPMAILKIARMGHPVLRRTAVPIEDPGAPEVHRLVSDMLDTLEDAGGTGLAAPQVHVPWRLVLFYGSAERARRGSRTEGGADSPEEPEEVPLTVLINPVVEPIGR